MYEAKHQKPLARAQFRRRPAWHMSGAGLLGGMGLVILHRLPHLFYQDED